MKVSHWQRTCVLRLVPGKYAYHGKETPEEQKELVVLLRRRVPVLDDSHILCMYVQGEDGLNLDFRSEHRSMLNSS